MKKPTKGRKNKMSPAQVVMEPYLAKPWMNPLATWRELTPLCAAQSCTHRAPIWNGVFGRSQGVVTNHGWFCSPECFERSLSDNLFAILRRERVMARTASRLPIGLLLMSRGEISHEDLKKALQIQRKTGMRIGDCIRQIGTVTESAITAALAAQWACPVFPAASVDPALASLVPLVLLETYHMIPVHFGDSGKKLFVGFSEGVDYSVLYGMEQLLNCHTEACMIPSTTLTEALAQQQSREQPDDVVIESHASAAEIARMTTSYAQQIEAGEIRYAAIGDFVWVRLCGSRSPLNLLYHRHPQPARIAAQLK